MFNQEPGYENETQSEFVDQRMRTQLEDEPDLLTGRAIIIMYIKRINEKAGLGVDWLCETVKGMSVLLVSFFH